MIDPSCYVTSPTIDINDQVHIRSLRIEDAPDYLKYMRNPNVQQYVLVEKQSTLSYAISHINYCKDMMRARQGIFWAIASKENDKMIGWLALYTNNPDMRAEIAFDLAEEYWGQGIMTQVIKQTLRFAFDHMALIRVSALLLKDNVGSAKSLTKNGFVFEATFKNYKYFRKKCYDTDSYVLTCDDYKRLGDR